MKLSGVSWNPSTKKDKHYESSDWVPKSSDVLVKSKGIVLIACWLGVMQVVTTHKASSFYLRIS